MDDVPTREAVPERYKWDLDRIVPSPDAWAEEYDAVDGRVEELAALAAELDGDALDADRLHEVLALRDELNRRKDALWLRARLAVLQDTTDEAWRGRLSRYHSLKARVDDAASPIEPAVQAAGRERIEALVDDHEALARYDYHLDGILRRADHVRSPAVERVLAELKPSLDAPRRTLRTLKNRDFEPPVVETPDGGQRTVTARTYGRLLAHPDRAFRRRVDEAYDAALSCSRHARAQAFVDHLQTRTRTADLRAYDSALSATLDGTLPRETYDALASTVRENLGPSHRRLELLADREGIDDLRPWDTQRPLADGQTDVPYDEAEQLVVDAVEPLGEDYQRRLRRLLAEGRVDAYETEHKQSEMKGASFYVYETGPFVHLNYDAGDLESLLLFAHELSHAMHQSLAGEVQPKVYGELPDHLGEIPSFCHEALLVEHLRETRDARFRARVVDAWLRHLSLFRAAKWLTFVEGVYEALDDGERPGADRLDELYGEVAAEFLAPVTLGERHRRAWMRQHLLGISGGLAVARRLRAGALPSADYLAFLRAGDSEYPVDLLDRIGLSFASGEPVADAVDVYDDLLDELAGA